MRWLGKLAVVALAVASLASGCLRAADSWSLTSPDGQCEIRVTLNAAGHLTYQVSRAGKTALRPAPLGLRCNDQEFTGGLRLEQAAAATARPERYELLAGPVPHVNHELNLRQLKFRNLAGAPLVVELAAANEGVAFRYVFPDTNAAGRIVESEQTGFALPPDASGWLQPFHAAGPYTPAYEDFYFFVTPGTPPPDSRARAIGWAFPALFQVPQADAWVLLTESGTDGGYCACHLGPDSAGGLYHIAFPAADETTQGWTNRFGPEPRITSPASLPWRVIVLGRSAGDIALATLVTDLAPPTQVADTSWIKPGRASWMWWSYPDGPATAARFDEFTDLAARMGWEYTLFDAGWWQPGLEKISRYAQFRNVMPLAWLHAADFYDPARRAKKLDEMVAAGIRGVKVDFWCSDRQEAMAAMQGLFRDAAARKLLVNLHGCTIPRGWQRTWPNFLTAEAVLGSESYFYEPSYTEKAAELDTVLPFTRNAVGPMDVTPVACSPKKYPRTTTAAHQLAAALVFTSGLVHYADSPEFFATLPAAMQQVLRDAPARWDETRWLTAEPGREVIFARRAGNSWFIAGLNGTAAARPVDLDLTAFAGFPHRVEIVDGPNALMEVTATNLPIASRWQHEMPARGGFILRLDK
ncbi:MAG TPA: glycoside hydrolase family 97 catalytic domain-containing protein [Dongiaceae bacterium]|jgi:hypothetical protein|nr:glycoside hydrolase family 97 catalytic domain-containing protein [Dongiaceae bacterium]